MSTPIADAILKLKRWIVLGYNADITLRMHPGGHCRIVARNCGPSSVTEADLDHLQIGDGEDEFRAAELDCLRLTMAAAE